MPNLRIVPRNFHDEASLATELAPVDGYSIDNTKDAQRSRVWRSSDGTDQYVAGSFDDGVARKISFFGFFRHRCHGGSVRLRLYGDVAYSVPVYDSGAVPVINITPTYGLDWGVDTYGDGSTDPFITETPFWLWFDSVECLSYKISFSGNVSTYGYAYWQVARFFLGHTFELDYTAQYGATLNVVSQTDRNRSRGGSLRTNVGPTWRTMTMDIIRLPESQRAAWLDVMRYLGTGRDFVLSLFPEEGTRKERDHILNCKFPTLDAMDRWHPSFLKKRIQVEEI